MFKAWHFSFHTEDLGSSLFNLVNFVITAIESAYAKYLFLQPSCLQYYFLSCLSYVEISEVSTVSFGNTPASGACREVDMLGH